MNNPPIPFREHEEHVRAAARAALRQRLSRRRHARHFATSLLLLSCAIGIFRLAVPSHNQKPSHIISHEALRTPESQSVLMTDEELLAVFPPGSCEFVEIDGRKQLVFLDASVKSRFFN